MSKLHSRNQNSLLECHRTLWQRSILTLLKIGGAVAVVLLVPSVANASITMITDPLLVSDSNGCSTGAGPRAAYVGFKVTNNTGITQTNLQATITGFSSGFSLTQNGSQPQTQYIGTLANNASRTVYWHFQYPCHTNINKTNTFTVTVNNANTLALIDSATGTVTSNSSISASAGGLISSTTLGAGAVLGQIITYDVKYSFGNVQSGDRFNLQPAGNTNFRSDCLQLLSTKVLSSDVNAIPINAVDQLFYQSTGSQGGSGNLVSIRYFFLYQCNGITSSASPYASQTSGSNNLKYSSNFGAVTISFPAATNSFSITKTATPNSLTDGGTVTYTITITNNSTTLDARIDRITDILPNGVTFGSTITGLTGTVSAPSNGDTGTIKWLSQSPNFFEIKAGQSIQLVYTATIPDIDGTYTNSAKAGFGFGETNPATANVIVAPPVYYDYGDAPDTATGTGTNNYQTISSDGNPSHTIVSGIALGANIDADSGTLQNDNADADDANGTPNDEDGVKLGGSSLQNQTLNVGNNATLNITTQGSGKLSAWIDWNQDGDFLDTGEKIATDVTPTSNAITLPITIPSGATTGTTYARFRYSTQTGLASTGTASNGEIEDYKIAIAFKANSDLSPNFCQASSSARNLLFILDDSSSVNATELQQQRNAIMATLNDFVAKNLTGKAAIVAFDSVGNTVINYTDITAANLSTFKTALDTNYGDEVQGTHWEKGFQAGIDLPGGTQPNVVFFFTDGANNSGNNPDGKAAQFKAAGAHIYGIGIELTVDNGFKGITDGSNTIIYDGSNIQEADYLDIDSYNTLQNQFTNAFLANLCPADFGDAPDTYGTDNIANSITNPLGANHDIVSELFIGAKAPDTDANGFVDGIDNNSGNAIDDDAPIGTGSGNGDDEGNFTFPTLNAGKKSYTIPTSSIIVTNATEQIATLHAWIDFNKNGTFEPTEYASSIVGTGSSNPQTNLTWTGISIGTVGNTYARFRLTSDNNINDSTPGGNANDGEVEDYQVAIAQASDPNLLLVKRITAINPGQPGEMQFNNFIDDPGTTDDTNPNWPNTNNYLQGEISVPQVKPGDEVEYTIYFLSNGDIAAKDVKICDAIPDNMTFNKHSYGTEVGISVALDPTNLPNNTNKDLSNLIGDDEGSFYAPGTNPPLNLCKKHDPSDTDNLVPHNLISVDGSNNLSGTVLIHLINPLPPATASGTPPNSSGFVRFRAKVK